MLSHLRFISVLFDEGINLKEYSSKKMENTIRTITCYCDI